MLTATIEDVQARLPQLLERLASAGGVLIVRDGQPVARLLLPEMPKGLPVAGRGKGKLTIISDDDAHLDDFREYMA